MNEYQCGVGAVFNPDIKCVRPAGHAGLHCNRIRLAYSPKSGEVKWGENEVTTYRKSSSE